MESPFCVLCVDDNAVGLSVRKLVLETHGYKVFEATTPESALIILANHHIDLVIIDYFLGDLSGTELAAKIKETQPDISILLLSGGNWEELEGLRHVDAAITKIAGVEKLFETISALLSKGNTATKNGARKKGTAAAYSAPGGKSRSKDEAGSAAAPPRKRSANGKDAVSLSAPPQMPDEGFMASILCVDDDLHVLALNAGILKSAGHTVTAATSAHEAIKELQAHSYDAVVTDWRLGGGSGREVVKVAKSHFGIPVVVVSGYVADAFQAAEPFADLYLEKPISPEELVSIINELLKTSRK